MKELQLINLNRILTKKKSWLSILKKIVKGLFSMKYRLRLIICFLNKFNKNYLFEILWV